MRTRTRLCVCLLVACLATGCETLRGFQAPPPVSPPAPTDQNAAPKSSTNTDTKPDAKGGGTAVAAGGVGGSPDLPQIPQAPGSALSPPRPLPGGAPISQSPPVAVSGVPGTTTTLSPNADPHLRGSPTVSGGRWGLGPYDTPGDRLYDLTRNLDVALAQNRELMAHNKDLETLLTNRDLALLEATREIQSLNDDILRNRTAHQAKVAELQGKIKALDDDDIAFLRALLRILNELSPERK